MTPEQEVIAAIQAGISALSQQEQVYVAMYAERFRKMVSDSEGPLPRLAFALVGAEMAAENV